MSRPPDRRPPGAYVHGADGPVAVVSGRTAAWLLAVADLARLRIAHRGMDAEIDNQLLAVTHVANAWRAATSATSADSGSALDELPEVAPGSKSMTTRTAAERIGITDRAVRLACDEGRIPATRVNGRWQLERSAVEDFRSTR